NVRARFAEQVAQPRPRRVVSHHSYRNDARSQRAEVRDGIRAAARLELARFVADDQDRRLAADPVGLAVQVLVRDEIADDRDARGGEAIDERAQLGIGLHGGGVSHGLSRAGKVASAAGRVFHRRWTQNQYSGCARTTCSTARVSSWVSATTVEWLFGPGGTEKGPSKRMRWVPSGARKSNTRKRGAPVRNERTAGAGVVQAGVPKKSTKTPREGSMF